MEDALDKLIEEGKEQYALYVKQNLESFKQAGIKEDDLSVVFKTLSLAGVKPVGFALEYPPTQHKTLEFVERKRKAYELSAPTKLLSEDLLKYFFDCINKDFFDGLLPVPMLIISTRLTNSAAYYCRRNGIDEITFSMKRYTDAFSGGKTEAMASGVRCKNRLQYVEVTMEHEMIHYAISYSEFAKNNPSLDKAIIGSHGLLFKKLAEQLFHHSSIYCNTDDTTELGKLTRSNLKLKDQVKFKCKQGIEYTAEVKRLNEKTATLTCKGADVRVSYSLLYK